MACAVAQMENSIPLYATSCFYHTVLFMRILSTYKNEIMWEKTINQIISHEHNQTKARLPSVEASGSSTQWPI